MVFSLFPLAYKGPNLTRFQRAQNAVWIEPIFQKLVPDSFLLRVMESRFLRIPELVVGFDPPKEGSQLVCI